MGQHQSIDASPENIPELVTQLCVGNSSGKRNGAAALASLSNSPQNQSTILNYGGISPLVVLLRNGKKHEKTEAARALARLSSNHEIKAEIAAIGGISPLVTLTKAGNSTQKESAISALLNLATVRDNHAAIVDAGAIPILVAIVRGGRGPKTLAAAVFAELATNSENVNVLLKLRVVSPLVGAIGDSTDIRTTYAMTALQALTENGKCKVQIVRAGGIPKLVQIVRGGSDEQKTLAGSILRSLSKVPDNVAAIAKAGAIPVFVKLLHDVDLNLKTIAVGVLENLSNTEKNPESIVAAGGIQPLVELLTTSKAELKHLCVLTINNIVIFSSADSTVEAIVAAGAIAPLLFLLTDRTNVLTLGSIGQILRSLLLFTAKPIFRDANGIPRLIDLLRDGHFGQKAEATSTLKVLAKDFENRAEMTTAGCIPLLVASAREDSNPYRQTAVLMLSCLSMYPECIEELAETGAIEQFVIMLRDGLDGFEIDIIPLTLIQVARSDVGKKAIDAAGAIPLLISLVRTGKSSDQKESCAQVLVNLSTDERLREVIESARRGRA